MFFFSRESLFWERLEARQFDNFLYTAADMLTLVAGNNDGDNGYSTLDTPATAKVPAPTFLFAVVA